MATSYTFDDFLAFIDAHEATLRAKRPNEAADHRMYALTRLGKLTEEAGEVADAILTYYGAQRASKQKQPSTDSIAEELADMYIVLTVIAKHFDLDVYELLQRKAAKMEQRRAAGDV